MARLGRSARTAACIALLVVLGCGDKKASKPDATKDGAVPADTDGGAVPAADGGGGGGGGGGSGAGSGAPPVRTDAGGVPEGCAEPRPNQPPELLSCTGLYGDIADKAFASGVREFKPAVELWSDGADKRRWIYLPPGTTIDITDPDGWKFPVGTKLWKEFIWKGTRVETRMFWKMTERLWIRTAYKWNTDETEATRSGGEEVDVNGDAYHIPSTTECDQCHGGAKDKVLGFEAVLLGLPGATGITLANLADDGLLTGGKVPDIAIGDDGTGYGTEALPWLHVNCGVSCHNGNPSSKAYSTHLRMRLLVSEADGSSTSSVDLIDTNVDQPTSTGRWMPGVRVVPGKPADSWLYKLMSKRDAVNMKDQMPPIASKVVPKEAVTLIRNWITALPQP